MHRVLAAFATALTLAVIWFCWRYWALITELALFASIIVIPSAIARTAALIARLPRGSRHHWLLARWYRLRWRWLAANLGLSYLDRHRRGAALPGGTVTLSDTAGSRRVRVRFPRASFRADAYGITATVRTVPGTGLAEFEKAAEHIRNAHRAARVGISQPRPGRLVIRSLRRDPLAEPLPSSAIPAWDGRNVFQGRDEHGTMRSVSLANLAGSIWAGNPGRGKTECGLSWAYQLAASPLVDMHVLDGGACDWVHFGENAESYVTDDLQAAAELLEALDQKMRDRRRDLEADLGVRNGWLVGPSAEYPLQWVLMEEAPFYLSLDAVKGDKKREPLVARCRAATGNLIRRGRAPMFHTSLMVQRATTTNMPSDIRDLCGIRWSFGCSTVDSAIACLGDDIREYPSMSPAGLQGPEHVGVASMLLRSGTSPFTLVKFPWVGEELADKTAAAMRTRRQPQQPPEPALQLVPPAAEPEPADVPLPAAVIAS